MSGVLYRLSYIAMAGEEGIEPSLNGSEPSVLPVTPLPKAFLCAAAGHGSELDR